MISVTSPGRRTAKAMHPFVSECFLMTSAADMHVDSVTKDGSSSPATTAAATVPSDLNSRGMSCKIETEWSGWLDV